MVTVEEAVQRDLERLPEELRTGTIAAAALELGRQMDSPSNSATSKSMCANALRDLMARLAELAPPKQEADRLDDLTEQRRRRLERQSKATASPRS